MRQLCLLLLLLTFIVSYSSAEHVEIPDPNLAGVIRLKLNLNDTLFNVKELKKIESVLL